MTDKRRRIAIVGGNFAGLTAAIKLSRRYRAGQQVLAGAKEGVYQLFMSQMTPGGLLTSLPAAAGRLWQSWRQLALPQLLSLADFKKLPDRRTVRRL